MHEMPLALALAPCTTPILGGCVLREVDRQDDGLEGEKNVRSKAERCADGGKTWTSVFDIVFRPHPSDAGS